MVESYTFESPVPARSTFREIYSADITELNLTGFGKPVTRGILSDAHFYANKSIHINYPRKMNTENASMSHRNERTKECMHSSTRRVSGYINTSRISKNGRRGEAGEGEGALGTISVIK